MKISKELIDAVNSYKEGDVDSFNQIYTLSYGYLHTCIIHIVKDEELAMDMLQDTYIQISKSIGQLNNSETFLKWAAMIANRKCFAYLKKKKDVLLGETEDDNNFFEEIADDEELIPESVLQDREKQRLMKEIIDNLTEMQRLCVIGFYYNEQSLDEIAKELDIPVNTVKSHLNRAKAKIKEAVIELDEKKGTRLYSIAPFMLLFFEKEIMSCDVKAMTPELAMAAASTGAKAAVAEGGKAAGAKAAAVVKAKIAAGALAIAVAAGGIAYVAHLSQPVKQEADNPVTDAKGSRPQEAQSEAEKNVVETETEVKEEEENIPVLEAKLQKGFDEIIQICQSGDYEQFEGLNPDYFLNGQLENYTDEMADTIFVNYTSLMNIQEEEFSYDRFYYDGSSSKLVKNFSGYGMGIAIGQLVVGNFVDGNPVGEVDILQIDFEKKDRIPNVYVIHGEMRNGKLQGRVRRTSCNFPDGMIHYEEGEVAYFGKNAPGLQGSEVQSIYKLVGAVTDVGRVTKNSEDEADEGWEFVLHINSDGTLDRSQHKIVKNEEGEDCIDVGNNVSFMNCEEVETRRISMHVPNIYEQK